MLIVLDQEILNSRLLLFPSRRVISFNHQSVVKVVYIQTISRSISCDQDQRRGEHISFHLVACEIRQVLGLWLRYYSPNRSMGTLTVLLRPKTTSWWTHLVSSRFTRDQAIFGPRGCVLLTSPFYVYSNRPPTTKTYVVVDTSRFLSFHTISREIWATGFCSASPNRSMRTISFQLQKLT